MFLQLIPPAFVEKMEGKLASKLVLKCECGRLYTIQIKELEDGKIFFTNGWPQFVKDHGLDYGDFIVFRLIKDSTFEVTIFDPSMCEKQCCDSHRNKVGVQVAMKEIKGKTNTSLSLSLPPPPPGVQAAMKEIKGETNTNSDQDHPKGLSLTKGKQESATEIDSDSSDDELEVPCSNTEAPSFRLLLNEANKIYLPLPPTFVTKSGLARKREVKVRDLDGKKWVVKIAKDGKRVGLTVGWTGVFVAHRLKKGDTCIFTFVSRLGVEFIQVDFKRGRGRPPKNP